MGTQHQSGIGKYSTCLEHRPRYNPKPKSLTPRPVSKNFSGEIKYMWQNVYSWSVQVKGRLAGFLVFSAGLKLYQTKKV
jgi:hypothetical protein